MDPSSFVSFRSVLALGGDLPFLTLVQCFVLCRSSCGRPSLRDTLNVVDLHTNRVDFDQHRQRATGSLHPYSRLTFA